jgi:hypothetical protein
MKGNFYLNMILTFQELADDSYEEYIQLSRDCCHFPILWVDAYFRFRLLVDDLDDSKSIRVSELVNSLQIQEFDNELLEEACNQIEELINTGEP